MADQPRVLTGDELRERLRRWVIWLRDVEKTKQADIAEATDLSQAHISNICSGKANVGLDTFALLHYRLRLDPWRMLNKDPELSERERVQDTQDERRRRAPGRRVARK